VRVDDPAEKLHAGVPAFVTFHRGNAVTEAFTSQPSAAVLA
jgi:hypothetical protein